GYRARGSTGHFHQRGKLPAVHCSTSDFRITFVFWKLPDSAGGETMFAVIVGGPETLEQVVEVGHRGKGFVTGQRVRGGELEATPECFVHLDLERLVSRQDARQTVLNGSEGALRLGIGSLSSDAGRNHRTTGSDYRDAAHGQCVAVKPVPAVQIHPHAFECAE